MRRTLQVRLKDYGAVTLKPLIQLSSSYVLVIPVAWVHAHLDADDPRVIMQPMGDHNGIALYPYRGSTIVDATPGPDSNLLKAEFGCIPDKEVARDSVAFLRSVRRGHVQPPLLPDS